MTCDSRRNDFEVRHILDPVSGPDQDAVVQPPVDETQFVPDGEYVPPPAASPPPLAFGRFRVQALLGTGATGSVYRAHDETLNRSVAIKTLHHSCDGAVRTRFLNEARAIGSVQHPNILAVFEAGTEKDTPYMVMELASGSLRDAMRARSLDASAVRSAGIQIARALSAAHAAKIVHRDVKPANILATDAGTWKLADFGIARLPDSTLTDTGQFLGSPSYAAPESLRAGTFTPASDIYALAATLYEAFAGAPPHGEHDMPSVVRKLEHDPPPLHLRCPVPRAIADAIMSALSRDPAARPTAEQFANQLAVDSSSAEPIVAQPPQRIVRIAIGAAVVAACLLALAIVTRMRATAEVKPAVFASPRVNKAKPPPPKPEPPVVAERVPEPPADVASGPELAPPEEAIAEEPPEQDPWGPPGQALVDDETARRMLEQFERDAQSEMNRYRKQRRPNGRRARRYDPF